VTDPQPGNKSTPRWPASQPTPPGYGQPGYEQPTAPPPGFPPPQPGYQPPGPRSQPPFGQPPYGQQQPGQPWPQTSQPKWNQRTAKKKKKWPWIVGGVLLLLVGSCTAIGLLVESEETKQANKFISALYTSTDSAEAYLCSDTGLSEIFEGNRRGLVTLRKDLLAKGWKGAKNLDRPRKVAVEKITIVAIKGTLATSPPANIEIGLLKYKGTDISVPVNTSPS
jgi:hypothetical protein